MGHLDQGNHILTVANLNGFNALNVVMVAPSQGKENEDLVGEGKKHVYIFEGVDRFYY